MRASFFVWIDASMPSFYDNMLSYAYAMIMVTKYQGGPMSLMRRRRISHRQNANLAFFAQKAVSSWVALAFDRFSLYARFVTPHGEFISDRIARLLGVHELEERIVEDRSGVIAEVRRRCRAILEEESPLYPDTLARNIDKISRFIAFSEDEAQILAFAVMLRYFGEIDDAFGLLGDLSSIDAISALSSVLDIPIERVKTALSTGGLLAKSGMLEMDMRGALRLGGKLDLLSNEFADMMIACESQDAFDFFKQMVRPVAPGSLDLDDYGYMRTEIKMLVRYLSRLPRGAKGANILLYGAPGTGKTELAKALAATLKWDIYEVSYADEEDDPMSRKERLRAYKSAQYLFGDRPVLLMFDEAEDVFDADEAIFNPWMTANAVQKQKGWMNRMLENGRVPTIWIFNDVSAMDPAVLRRFDIVLKMPIPPKRVRKEMVRTAFGKLIDERLAEAIAEHDRATPAVLSRAAEILARLSPKKEEGNLFARRLVSGTLEAQGHRPLPKPRPAGGMAYDPAFVNADADLKALAEGIAAHPNARLCLYGLPGTGKSAFGRWLADRLGRPFLLKTGSDLLSMYVGGTEANIAAAFNEAEREGAVLVFDEVDGFLLDRRQAQRNWEVTQVNELLTRMEGFEGIFIATTNLMENLDPASLRRFDLKVKFDAMRPEQAQAMFKRACRTLGLPNPDRAALQRVAALRDLTPGDFAAVMRQHRFRPFRDACELVTRLEEECMAKRYGERIAVVGFINDETTKG
jgi:SpoVK/Ycf46/Vps4 family AAA+-type ATPase